MSIKIYNGIKFKSNNIKEVLDQLVSIKEKAKVVALNFIQDKDLHFFIIANKLQDKSTWDISADLIEAIDCTNRGKWALVPSIYFSVVVYPTTEGDIYGYYFDSNKKEYRDLLEPFYTDFHYQNQSDPPMDIHSDEWDFRREKWEELVDYKFKDTGLTYNFVTGEELDMCDLETRIKIVLEKMKREQKIDSVL